MSHSRMATLYNQLLARLLTYRLVIEQKESGLWGNNTTRPMGVTSGSFAVGLRNSQLNLFSKARKDKQNKGKIDTKRYNLDLGEWRRRIGYTDANKLPQTSIKLAPRCITCSMALLNPCR